MSKMTASYQMFGPDGQRGVLTNEDSLNFGAISDVDQKFYTGTGNESIV